jgi:hypothetical protein
MLNVASIGRYSSAGLKAPCRNSDTRWLRLRLNVDSSAHAAISAPTGFGALAGRHRRGLPRQQVSDEVARGLARQTGSSQDRR